MNNKNSKVKQWSLRMTEEQEARHLDLCQKANLTKQQYVELALENFYEFVRMQLNADMEDAEEVKKYFRRLIGWNLNKYPTKVMRRMLEIEQEMKGG